MCTIQRHRIKFGYAFTCADSHTIKDCERHFGSLSNTDRMALNEDILTL